MPDSIAAKTFQQPRGQRGYFYFSMAQQTNRPRYGMT
jgi:hypothetical protein